MIFEASNQGLYDAITQLFGEMARLERRIKSLEDGRHKPETWRDVTAECEIREAWSEMRHRDRLIQVGVLKGYRIRKVRLKEQIGWSSTGEVGPHDFKDVDAFIIERKEP